MNVFTTLKLKHNIIDPVAVIDVFILALASFFVFGIYGEHRGIKLNMPANKPPSLYRYTTAKLFISDNEILLNGTRVGSDTLIGELSEDVPYTVVVSTDYDVSHRRFVNVIDIIKKAGVSQIIVSKKQDKKE